MILYEDETQRQPVDPDLPNLHAWRPGRVLQIGDSRFSITYNPPTAEKVQTSKFLLSTQIVAVHRPKNSTALRYQLTQSIYVARRFRHLASHSLAAPS